MQGRGAGGSLRPGCTGLALGGVTHASALSWFSLSFHFPSSGRFGGFVFCQKDHLFPPCFHVCSHRAARGGPLSP